MQTIEPRSLPDGATLRSAVVGDASRIHELIRELAVFERDPDAVVTTPETIVRALTESGSPVGCHVIELSGIVEAIALWNRNFSTWTGEGIWLEDLYVTAGHRGRGWGRALLEVVAETCAVNGWQRMQWCALAWNTRAIDVYRGIGASRLDDWVTFRLDGVALGAVASRGAGRG